MERAWKWPLKCAHQYQWSDIESECNKWIRTICYNFVKSCNKVKRENRLLYITIRSGDSEQPKWRLVSPRCLNCVVWSNTLSILQTCSVIRITAWFNKQKTPAFSLIFTLFSPIFISLSSRRTKEYAHTCKHLWFLKTEHFPFRVFGCNDPIRNTSWSDGFGIAIVPHWLLYLTCCCQHTKRYMLLSLCSI